MANFNEKYEFSAKPKSSFFNWSFTMHAKPIEPSAKPRLHNPYLDRGGSMKKVHNSIESSVHSGNSLKGKVKKLRDLFESSKSPSRSPRETPTQLPSRLKPTKSFVTSNGGSSLIRLPGTEDGIVVYLTSLRGVRRTYEDCYVVRMIFKGFRVWIDERDISLHLAYRKELQNVLGNEKPVSLPQVFIGGRYIGGADVIRQLYDTGELAKILSGYPKVAPGSMCNFCGDARFMPCTNCSGSRKVFDENEEKLNRCLECNENGLIQCPHCC
ncbi:hypothetical protein SAY86_001958 [Trapa natans]|uniref:Glutaredoxin domain-containing protein n=1 Tax=Trapa natans TaxID=22666 RepID=A0AAN7QZ42_TRANT|nr:hypothetical protein SAY86_001958 [Trapa natans]